MNKYSVTELCAPNLDACQSKDDIVNRSESGSNTEVVRQQQDSVLTQCDCLNDQISDF